jgi:hypothetical protein
MAHAGVIDDHRLGPVAEARRENGASFYILVQIQAGPPVFAALPLRLGKPAGRRPDRPQIAG